MSWTPGPRSDEGVWVAVPTTTEGSRCGGGGGGCWGLSTTTEDMRDGAMGWGWGRGSDPDDDEGLHGHVGRINSSPYDLQGN